MMRTDEQKSIKPGKHLSKLCIGIGFLFVAVIATGLIFFLPDKTSMQAETNSYHFKRNGTASFYGANGAILCDFKIEIADTPESMKTGLMYRDSLGIDEGMLFVYDKPDILSFWMKNTYLPLDIIFIGSDSTIVSMAQRTTPYNEQAVDSKSPSQFALEVNAGVAAKFNLQLGNRFSWSRD
jgi:uncharacterized membrane protein (UPF0127 family)